MPTEEQVNVINHIYGPAAVLSGAGSGKTTTLVNRINKLCKVTTPEKIVMLTFTNAAADDMKKKAIKSNEACKNIIAGTYHKYCGTMLRKYGRTIGIEPSYEILTGMKYKTLIEYVKSSNEYYESLKDFPSATKLDTIFSKLINTDKSVSQLIYGTKYSNYSTEIENLYQEVKEYGLKHQKLNFDDMLVYMNQLLDNDDICEKIATSFDYLMVDEFQDTNNLQLSILLKLSRYNKNIVVVGDISQSIYKFRGAEVENIQKFIDSVPGCITYKLSTNFRSTQEILDAVNSIMNKNSLSWTYTDMVADNNYGNKPLICRPFNLQQQAEDIIKALHYYTTEGYDLCDIAIIERRSNSSFQLESILNRNNIPFEKRGGLKLTEYACVDEFTSFLSIISKKSDSFSWYNVLKLIPKIGNKTATEISSKCKEKNFLDDYSKKSYYDGLVSLNNFIDATKSKTHLDDILKDVEQYYFTLRKIKINNSHMSSSALFDAKEKIEKDKIIIEAVINMANGYTDLNSFLADLALDSVKTDSDENNKLILTTIHSAKGLEWPVVILLDAYESEFKEDYADEEEELRCLYVAMTRAEEELIISVPKSDTNKKVPVYLSISHFLTGSLSYFEGTY